MSRNRQRTQEGGGRRKASGAPRADQGLVALLTAAPGTSVKALQGQFVLCSVLGVLLLAVLLSLATDAHTRARQLSPPVPLRPLPLPPKGGQEGRAGQEEAEDEEEVLAESEDETLGADSGGEWGSKGDGVGAEGAGGVGTEEVGADATQRRRSQREGGDSRGGKRRWWPRTNAKKQGVPAVSFTFARGNKEPRERAPLSTSISSLSATRSTPGAPTAGASLWVTNKQPGRGPRRRYQRQRSWGAGSGRRRAGGVPREASWPPRPLPPWAPQPGRYFLAFCQLYGWTNKLICMERALMLAVLLNRTLILPQRNVCTSPRRPRNTDHMLIDVGHLRQCLAQGILVNRSAVAGGGGTGRDWGGGRGLGRGFAGWGRQQERERQQRAAHERLASFGVVTLHEYQRALGVRAVAADVLRCEMRKCPFRHCTSLGRLRFANATKPPIKLYGRPLTEFDLEVLRNDTAHARVLSFGDVFYTSVQGYPLPVRTSLRPLLGTPCPLPVRPQQPIFKLAEALAATQFSGPYAALHLRRGDFEKYLVERRIPYWSIKQVADCVASEMKGQGLQKLFLATDASFPERKQLHALLAPRNITFRLYRPGWRQTNMNQALVDKVMCAHAQVFLYERLSTFSGHILQLREGLGRNSSHDKPLCAGRHARFVPQAV